MKRCLVIRNKWNAILHAIGIAEIKPPCNASENKKEQCTRQRNAATPCYTIVALFVWAEFIASLPALSMVAAERISVKVLVPAAGIWLLLGLAHVGLLRILLQVRNVVGCMTSFENGVSC